MASGMGIGVTLPREVDPRVQAAANEDQVVLAWPTEEGRSGLQIVLLDL